MYRALNTSLTSISIPCCSLPTQHGPCRESLREAFNGAHEIANLRVAHVSALDCLTKTRLRVVASQQSGDATSSILDTV